jgi:hypothetical protein
MGGRAGAAGPAAARRRACAGRAAAWRLGVGPRGGSTRGRTRTREAPGGGRVGTGLAALERGALAARERSSGLAVLQRGGSGRTRPGGSGAARGGRRRPLRGRQRTRSGGTASCSWRTWRWPARATEVTWRGRPRRALAEAEGAGMARRAQKEKLRSGTRRSGRK